MDTTSHNPLVLANKARDTPLSVSLHPLVLLTISDYIARHTLRSQQGPIVGAILGQQTGRSTTLEHAYECRTLPQSSSDDSQAALLDEAWFTERLEQYRDVHKAPALDLVGMFMLGSVEGPQESHLPLLKQVRQLTGAEGGLVLLFHVEMVEGLRGGRLPMTLYETLSEGGEGLRFRELAFEVETGEAEMIGVDFVAKGGGNAMAVQKVEAVVQGAAESGSKGKGKGKSKAKEKEKDEAETNGDGGAGALSPEDEELIASLNAKANAIKMLDQRLNLIRTYLAELPSSYLTDATSNDLPPATTQFPLLRSINAMLSRLPLLAPPQPALPPSNNNNTAARSPSPSTAATQPPIPRPSTTLQTASSLERADVHITSLLTALTRVTAEAQSMGSKFNVIARERTSKERGTSGFNGPGRVGRFGGIEEDDEGKSVLA